MRGGVFCCAGGMSGTCFPVATSTQIIQSWLGVFRREAEVVIIDSREDWDAAKPIKVSGAFHSYNRVALADRVALLGDSFRRLEMRGDCCYVGGANTVEEVIAFLLDHHRRLPNRGNFDQQTLVGAALTGTHGFGPRATLMDSVRKAYRLDEEDPESPIVGVLIDTAPLTAYRVRQRSLPLSDVARGQAHRRAYAVLPYSDEHDPVCLVADYEEIDKQGGGPHPDHLRPQMGTPPLGLRLWWLIDRWFPPLRRVIQRALRHYRLDRTMVTSDHDVDALYDPFPGVAGKTSWGFGLWAYRPTYTCFNIALFVRPEDTEQLILDAIGWGQRVCPSLFRCMIGVRELTDSSSYAKAGNYGGPRNAVDFYCSTKHASVLIPLQGHLQRKYDVRPHLGKSVRDPEGAMRELSETCPR